MFKGRLTVDTSEETPFHNLRAKFNVQVATFLFLWIGISNWFILLVTILHAISSLFSPFFRNAFFVLVHLKFHLTEMFTLQYHRNESKWLLPRNLCPDWDLFCYYTLWEHNKTEISQKIHTKKFKFSKNYTKSFHC